MSDGYPTTPRMDQRFLEAFLTPRATRLCGYTLYPWCLKHRIWLTGLKHPIPNGDPTTPAQLVFFARVCSETPMGDPTLRDRFHAHLLSAPKRYVEAMAVVREHIRQDCWPKFWERKDEQGSGGRNRGMPWALSILSNLVKAGHSLEDALNLPECQAVWLSTAASIQAGGELDILTSDDEQLLDELQRVKASAPPPPPS